MQLDLDIVSLSLECISYKACRDEGWSLEKVDRIEREYRAYLQIIRNSAGLDVVAPTKDIDVFWHHHILDTKKYMEDCDVLFGSYVHHFPYSGIFGINDAKIQNNRVKNTVRLIEKYLA